MKDWRSNEYLTLGDNLTSQVLRLFEVKWDDDLNICKDNNGNCINWDDEISCQVSIDVKEGKVIQINFWGDGTIEFQLDNDDDSVNWAEFDKESLHKIIKVLDEIR